MEPMPHMPVAHPARALAPVAEAPLPWEAGGAVGVFSRGIARASHLRALLGAADIVVRPSARQRDSLSYVVGWGLKPNTAGPARFARQHSLPFVRLEDGFLRSVGLGVEGAPALSMVLDDRGIYYDATQPSRLEDMLAGRSAEASHLQHPQLLARARSCRLELLAHGLSKYNNSPVEAQVLPKPPAAGRVLVVDQTAGDISVSRGLLAPNAFDTMLHAAIAEHPGKEVVVKVHPDVLAGKKRGCLTRIPRLPNLRVLDQPHNPIELLQTVDHVYVATSQLGFEALMLDLPVTCFGVPFYAGWGLTDDRAAVPSRRGVPRSLDALFAAAYLRYARYVDPDTGQACELERVIEHLALQRRMFRENKGRFFCFGFDLWKQNYTRAYLKAPGNQVYFARSARAALCRGMGPGDRALVWGHRDTPAIRDLVARTGAELWRMEDGFLRSVGLGSDLTAPASLAVDPVGVYYDPRTPSALERTLAEAQFGPAEQQRAAELRRTILAAGLSKYNLDDGVGVAVGARPGQTIVLVPGQVEDDTSVRLGTVDTCTNAALLRAARAARPDAYVIYKPHPDVVSGNRRGAVPADVLEANADEVAPGAGLARCLEAADEVHTMTSLVGFEALLRDKRVVVYGRPFYAGWGLTEDRQVLARRGRKLTIDQLVAGTLLRYPRYLNVKTGEFTTAERVVDLLLAQRAEGGAIPTSEPRPLRQARRLLHALRGLVYAR